MRARSAVGACALVAVLLPACRVGGWNDTLVGSGFGSEVRLETATGELKGELLLVRPDGIVFLSNDRAILAPWGAIEKLSFRGYPVDDVKRGVTPPAVRRGYIALASRYPHGLTEGQLDALLASLGQEELEPLP
ncbi:MAG TPA: hypothetical protein VML95_10875 [Longimicrobiales bacterium]|nr:hypothetical protein [Longimicrobiales bacterium]